MGPQGAAGFIKTEARGSGIYEVLVIVPCVHDSLHKGRSNTS